MVQLWSVIWPTCRPGALPENLSLAAALEAVTGADGWVTVVNRYRQVVGILTAAEVMAGYRADQRRSTSEAMAGLVLMKDRVGASSALAHRRVVDLELPCGSLVESLSRGGHELLPAAETTLEAGDLLGVVTRAADVVALRRSLASTPPQRHPALGQGLGPGRMI